jgi:starvation-inducible DNA-binding protein
MTTKSQPAHTTKKGMPEAQPNLQQESYLLQQYGQQHYVPLGLPEETIRRNVEMLNQLLADSLTIYSLYKKHHWQVAGPTFYQLHLLFEKHAEEILETVDLVGERIQALGGVAIAMPFDVAEKTKIERPPAGEENVPAMLARTANAHVLIIKELREGISLTEQNKDAGTNDLLISGVLREHEEQLWFITQHLVDTPLADSNPTDGAGRDTRTS